MRLPQFLDVAHTKGRALHRAFLRAVKVAVLATEAGMFESFAA
jgi:hypothetical protein